MASVRVATYHTDLRRDGPGLLLRDILSGRDPQVEALAQVVATLAADVIVLQRVDHDAGLVAAHALRDAIGAAGWYYPHVFARPPNSGVPTGLDMDGDRRLGRARDAQGFGRFRGAGGMLILSRHPIAKDEVRDFTGLLWRDLPQAQLPRRDGAPFPSAEAQAVQRLSSVAHWVVPVDLPAGRISLLTWHAAAPSFEGRARQNTLRNHDETRLWSLVLEGWRGPVPGHPVVLGVANVDPEDGSGMRGALDDLIRAPQVQPLAPQGHAGAATVDWSGLGLGQRRVSYILPAADLRVAASGVFWPAPDDPMAGPVSRASRHRPVWADLVLPAGADAPPPAPAPDPAESR